MGKRKEIVIGVAVLLCCCVAVLGYVKNLSCKDEKRVYNAYHSKDFGMITGMLDFKYSAPFYLGCSAEYKIPETLLVKKKCNIPDDVNFSETDILKYQNGNPACREIRHLISEKQEKSHD